MSEDKWGSVLPNDVDVTVVESHNFPVHRVRQVVNSDGGILWVWPEEMIDRTFEDMGFELCMVLPDEIDDDKGRDCVRFLIQVFEGDPVLRVELRDGKLILTDVDSDYVVIKAGVL